MGALIRRRQVLAGGAALSAAGCATPMLPPVRSLAEARPPDGWFTMTDGARLPYRVWPAAGAAPRVVVLALHGFNDSRDAWEIPAPAFQAAGMTIYAPDQRGFGQAPDRGRWAGVPVMTGDIVTLAATLRARHPGVRLVAMGESMGGALLMRAAVLDPAPPVDAKVMLAPAVWGRVQMGFGLSGVLWIATGVAPGWVLTGAEVPLKIRASDNIEALRALARNPLTIRRTRVDTLSGLTDAMDAAQAATPAIPGPALFLSGEHDQLVPPDATRHMWRRLPAGARRGFYPHGYHLLFRDLDRQAPIGDVIAWIERPDGWLPSGADFAAATWLATDTA